MAKRRLLMSALGMGVTYLMNNKGARDKLFGAVRNFMSKSKQPATTAPSSRPVNPKLP
ncbi:hypothetical protein [Paenibacillus swuensis]|uniref:hypothetical protein n=1 Tax=Paenibacillus swuensis TaxID=1178515 RepID=UPI000A6F8783|nr:hypothetical protein [Paenibacillus swuensis]